MSLSLADLVMLPEWTEVGRFHASAAYYLVQLPPPLTADWATLINTLAVACAALVILRGVRSPDKKQAWPLIAGLLFVLATAYGVCLFLLQSLNALAENWAWLAGVYSGTFVWFATMLIAALIVARSLDRAVRAAPSLLLVFLPIAALNIGLLAMRVVRPPAEPPVALREAASATGQSTEGKLVWLVFDELSERAVDAAAAHGVAFTEFRRFRETALKVSEARSPAIWTLGALPALTTGRPVCDALPDGLDSLRLEVQDEAEPLRWEQSESIFEQAAAAERAVGIVAWYHPYCRMFGEFATTCVAGADEMSIFRGWFAFADSIGPWRSALRQWTRTVEAEASAAGTSHAAGAPLDQLRDAQQRRSQMTSMLLEASEKAVRDDRLGFVMLHLPIPHPPGLAIEGVGDSEADYFSNMELADRTLGMVRAAMEEEGTWDSATVIVIADHGLRDFWSELPIWTADEEAFRQSLDPLHVPFLVKMPHQDAPLVFTASVSSTAIYDLSVEVLRGRANNAEQALQWFEGNAGAHPPACLSR